MRRFDRQRGSRLALMRAAVYHGVGDLRLEDIEEPVTVPGHVKLRVAYNGLCGTDLHEIFDSQRAVPVEPHPLTGARAPLVLGHEIGGSVVEVGEGVDDLEPETVVAVEPLMTCGVCRWCRSGDRNRASPGPAPWRHVDEGTDRSEQVTSCRGHLGLGPP
jgi:threonine dehydrogenase-like Zn-dependent dehydrogenase